MKLQKKTFAQVCILCLFRPACIFDLAPLHRQRSKRMGGMRDERVSVNTQ